MTSARTVLGPLTETFTAPSYCHDLFIPDTTWNVAFQAQTCTTTSIHDDMSCRPPVTPDVQATMSPTYWPLGGWGFYSPGTICPSGYSTACATTHGVTGGFDFQYGLIPSETAVGCCPT